MDGITVYLSVFNKLSKYYQSSLNSKIWSICIVTLLVLTSKSIEWTSANPLILCHVNCHCLDAFFDCSGRSLHSFPTDFPIWINKLNLSNNRIDVIESSDLSRLIHLESLFLDGNNLTAFPKSAQILVNLSQLTLSKNEIWRLDGDELSLFIGLHELDLSRNRLDVIDNSSFPRDNQLLTLNLASNNLEILNPGTLVTLKKLTELNLGKNRIKSIAKDALNPLTNLEKLDLSRNKLEVMDSLRFQELKKLQVLNLRRNHIGNLSDAAFYGLEKILQLYLDWNIIQVVDKRWLYGLRSLRTLNLSHNQVNRIEDDSWEFMEQIQVLDLSFNMVQQISQRTLSGLYRLKVLDLSNNRISIVEEDAFKSLEKLEILDLSQNELSWVLEDIPGIFRGLKEVESVNLASNQIHSLHPEALLGLGNLRSLNLSSNPITWLSEKAFLPIPNINLILTDINSLVCDCEIKWLYTKLQHQQSSKTRFDWSGRGWTATTNPRKVSLPKTTCTFPLELANRNLLDLTFDELLCSEKYRKPLFLEEPKSHVFLVEGNGSLNCRLNSPPHIPVTIHWRKDHNELSSELILTTDRIDENNQLEISSVLTLTNISWFDSGKYQCIGQGLGVVYSRKASVTIHIFPTFIKKPSNVTLRLGSNAKLECGAKGYPVPEIAFQKDGGEDFPAALERRFHVMPNDDSFFIMEVKLTDMGVYSCSAKNTAGEVRTYATVTVFETPSFLYRMEDQTAVEGSNAILECVPGGYPRPQVVWSKDGIEVVEGQDKRYHLTENGSLLVIKDVRDGDSGKYECFLTNAVGSARGYSTLVVLAESGGALGLDNATMTIIFIIIAVFCVVVTSAAWVVVIYSTRKRNQANSNHGTRNNEATPLRIKFDDLDMGPSSVLTTFTPLQRPFQVTQAHLGVCGDSGSQSSSGTDSGNGEELPDQAVITEGDEDWMKTRELENFLTFGETSRLSQARLDLKVECDNVISLMHTGKDFHSIPRRVPIPVVPPASHVRVHVDSLCVTIPNPKNRANNSRNYPSLQYLPHHVNLESDVDCNSCEERTERGELMEETDAGGIVQSDNGASGLESKISISTPV